MDPSLYGIVEMLMVFGIVFAFGFWQLASLRRTKRRGQTEKSGESRKHPPD